MTSPTPEAPLAEAEHEAALHAFLNALTGALQGGTEPSACFYEVLQTVRDLLGINPTQEELAALCAVTPVAAGRWIVGDRQPGPLARRKLYRILASIVEFVSVGARQNAARGTALDRYLLHRLQRGGMHAKQAMAQGLWELEVELAATRDYPDAMHLLEALDWGP